MCANMWVDEDFSDRAHTAREIKGFLDLLIREGFFG